MTAPSSAQHHGIVHVRLCVCRRRPRATSDKRPASMVAAWGLVSVTADLRPDRSDRHVADDLCRLLCSSGAVESEGLSWMRPLWSSLGVDAAGYAAGTATTRPRPPMDHPPSPHGPGMGPSPMSGSRTQGPTISFVRWRSKPALPPRPITPPREGMNRSTGNIKAHSLCTPSTSLWSLLSSRHGLLTLLSFTHSLILAWTPSLFAPLSSIVRSLSQRLPASLPLFPPDSGSRSLHCLVTGRQAIVHPE